MGRKKKIEVKAEFENPYSDKLPTTEEVLMNMKIEEVIEEVEPEKTPQQQAVWDFCEYWNGLKNHNIISDAEARHIHSFWQIAFQRTDFYVNCGICSGNHIKQLKKKAKEYGYECKK